MKTWFAFLERIISEYLIYINGLAAKHINSLAATRNIYNLILHLLTYTVILPVFLVSFELLLIVLSTWMVEKLY